MTKAIIFDCFGVLVRNDGLDTQLMAYIKKLRPNLKTAVLSNCGHRVLERVIGQTQLSSTFDAWLASADAGVSKPHPDIYNMICSRLGVQPEAAVFVDDVAAYVDTAERLGMTGLVFRGPTDLIDRLNRLLANPDM